MMHRGESSRLADHIVKAFRKRPSDGMAMTKSNNLKPWLQDPTGRPSQGSRHVGCLRDSTEVCRNSCRWGSLSQPQGQRRLYEYRSASGRTTDNRLMLLLRITRMARESEK